MKDQDPLDIGRFSVSASNAWTLPAPYYYSPAVYEAERKSIFFKSWRFVGHITEIAKPGDYLTQDICGVGVLVVRGRDESLRGFHNVCRHRAHRLLTERKGSLKAVITCPYHSWAYDFEGKLRTAKNSENVPGFNLDEFVLPRVAVEVFCGFVFVNLDLQAAPLAASAPKFEETLRRFVPDLDRMIWIGQKNFDIPANWKVCAENAVDGYHDFLSGPHHRNFSKVMDGRSLEMINRPGWILLHAKPGDPDNGVYDFRPNIGRGQTSRYVTFMLWPDLLIFTYPHVNAIWSFLMAPEGPERTREEIAAYTPGGVALDPISQAAVDWIADDLGPEDVALNIGVQHGVKSPEYFQGRLMIDDRRSDMSEHSILYFQALVLEALGRLPKGASAGLRADYLPEPE